MTNIKSKPDYKLKLESFIDSFEYGNARELYHKNPWFRKSADSIVYGHATKETIIINLIEIIEGQQKLLEELAKKTINHE